RQAVASRPNQSPTGRTFSCRAEGADASPDLPLSGVLAVRSGNCEATDSGDRPVAASSHEVEDAAESVRVTAAGLQLYRGDGRDVGVGQRQVHLGRVSQIER